MRASMRRSWWRNGAAALVALVAAGALFGVTVLLSGMERVAARGLDRLGADLVLAPAGQGSVAAEWLRTGEAGVLAPSLSVREWQQKLKAGRVLGIAAVEGWSLERGGAGEQAAGDLASLLLIRLEEWASPTMAVLEIEAAISEADIIEGEQSVRQVSRYTLPLVRHVGIAAVVSLLAAALMTGLLTAVQVSGRRRELGMMRAMGASRTFLIRLTLAETAVLTLMGASVGVALTMLAGRSAEGAARFAGALSAGEILLRAAGAILGTTLLGLLAALGPALRAASVDPMDAARREP